MTIPNKHKHDTSAHASPSQHVRHFFQDTPKKRGREVSLFGKSVRRLLPQTSDYRITSSVSYCNSSTPKKSGQWKLGSGRAMGDHDTK